MVDLATARLQLHKPAFHSTGVDCFRSLLGKVGRHQEQRWRIIFKCLTTRAAHLDLLWCMDADAYPLALRRFISQEEPLQNCGLELQPHTLAMCRKEKFALSSQRCIPDWGPKLLTKTSLSLCSWRLRQSSTRNHWVSADGH